MQERIRKAMLGLSLQPPIGDNRLMKGYDKRFRLRVGSYRVLIEVDHQEQIIYILTVDNRGDVY